MEQKINPPTARSCFYFYVNTKSGNGEGAKLIKLASDQSLFLTLDQHIKLRFVDLFDKSCLEQSLLDIKQQILSKVSDVRVIVCGGDGTVSWVINQIITNKIRLSNIVFGIFPIGTGNDMCRSLGWSFQQFQISSINLATQINRWLAAPLGRYDIWQVTLQTFKNGKIYDIHDKKQNDNQSQTLTKMFTNYVGLALDARIVYTMEKHRTSSAWINKILYGLVGCLNFFRPLKQLYRKISSFNDKNIIDKESTETDSNHEIIKSDLRVNNQRIYLNPTNISLKKGYRGIVCLNCTSYMAGLRNVWQTSSVASKQDIYQWKPQSSGDGLIQFVAFKSELNLALERIMRSGAKVAQGSGPFELLMNRPEKNEIEYVQIDGESIKIKNLRSIKISKNLLTNENYINVLLGA